jgi:hypothetical protein
MIAAVAAVLALLAPLGSAEVIVNMPLLVGRTKQGAEQLLGAPVSCQVSKDGELCAYRKGDTQVTFAQDGKADRIMVNDLAGAPYGVGVLPYLGFAPARPTSSDAMSVRWKNLRGLAEVAVFPSRDKASFAYVKVKKDAK